MILKTIMLGVTLATIVQTTDIEGLVARFTIEKTPVIEAEDTYLTDEVQGYCVEIGEKYGICPELLMSIIESESAGQAKARNGSCKGLMQINEPYHRERMKRLGITDLYSAYGNILVGTDYLNELVETYDDIGMVLMAYNMGDTRAEQYFDKGIFTSDYADKITQRSWELERLHGK